MSVTWGGDLGTPAEIRKGYLARSGEGEGLGGLGRRREGLDRKLWNSGERGGIRHQGNRNAQ